MGVAAELPGILFGRSPTGASASAIQHIFKGHSGSVSLNKLCDSSELA